MSHSYRVIDLGLSDFRDVWEIQKKWFNHHLQAIEKGESSENILIVCSHHPVYTLGKNGRAEHLLSDSVAPLIQIERGGDITFHGPGQMVIYPVFRLESFRIGISAYIQMLENVIIQVLSGYGLMCSTKPGAQGVWLDAETRIKCRKIAAVGVKSTKGVTMHGTAINLNTNLEWFSHIVPCGLPEYGVTSLSQELGKAVDESEFQQRFLNQFEVVFQNRMSNNE